ncbi:MAG: EAL domain-containing response regulator [Pseudomonadota bacterium]
MIAKHLLIIDDESDVGNFICEVVKDLGFEALATDNPDVFWVHYDAVNPVVIILDLKMPNVDGIELIRKLAECQTTAQIAIMSGADQRVLQSALQLGNNRGLRMLGILQKPIRVRDIEKLLGPGLSQLGSPNESDLRQAIEEGQITVHYQPKLDLTADHSCDVSSCEALARWDHPERGLLDPTKFISIAESTGLIGALTELILQKTLKQLIAWQAQGFTLSVSINISPLLLKDIDLPDRYHDMCRSNQIDTNRLILEITESAAMKDVTLTMDVLTRFRLKGFWLSLDDFGTGYSSLVQLHRMPFNEMKIDKSFIIESDTNTEAVKIIRSIAGLSNSLGIRLCAEGVESKKALTLVRDVGCHTAQGYLIGKPMSADNLSTFLRSRTVMEQREPTNDGEKS